MGNVCGDADGGAGGHELKKPMTKQRTLPPTEYDVFKLELHKAITQKGKELDWTDDKINLVNIHLADNFDILKVWLEANHGFIDLLQDNEWVEEKNEKGEITRWTRGNYDFTGTTEGMLNKGIAISR